MPQGAVREAAEDTPTGFLITIGLTRLTKVEAKGEDVARRSRATASKSRAF